MQNLTSTKCTVNNYLLAGQIEFSVQKYPLQNIDNHIWGTHSRFGGLSESATSARSDLLSGTLRKNNSAKIPGFTIKMQNIVHSKIPGENRKQIGRIVRKLWSFEICNGTQIQAWMANSALYGLF